MGYETVAMFDSDCDYCEGMIDEGLSLIVYRDGWGWVHKGCGEAIDDEQ